MAHPRATDEFLVLTQNILGGGPRWDLRRGLLAKRIAALRPDVVGLQEVHARTVTGVNSQAHELADLVGGYHVDFAPGRVAHDGACEGVALLCKHGIRERSVHSLTMDHTDRLDRVSQRVALCATLEHGHGAIDVFVTHLSLSKRARHRTMREVVDFAARERQRSASLGAVLMGDFNAPPDEATIKLLEAPTDGLTPWFDTWKLTHPAGFGGSTWPTFVPFRRIDYLFAQPRATWHVTACDVEPVSGSDHRGITARMRLAPLAQSALDPRRVAREDSSVAVRELG